MQFSRYTDYTLRVLIYLYIHKDRLSSIHEIATYYKISQNHLMKIVHYLGKGGFITTIRGRNGGLRLNKKAEEITLGSIIRYTDSNLLAINCQDCTIIHGCTFPPILKEALNAFYKVLDQYTLQAAITNPKSFHILPTITEPMEKPKEENSIQPIIINEEPIPNPRSGWWKRNL